MLSQLHNTPANLTSPGKLLVGKKSTPHYGDETNGGNIHEIVELYIMI